MATTGDGARRFMHALAAMLLVACSFPCAVGDGSSAAAVQQKAKALRDAVEGNNRAPPAAEPVVVAPERDSPGSLLDRGTALLYAGKSKDAVAALDAAITGWEEEMGSEKLNSEAAALTAQRLGEALALEGDHERAASVFGRAVVASEALFGVKSTQAVACLTGLGLALFRQGQLSDAASTLGRALSVHALRPDEGMVTSTQDVTKTLDGLAKSLIRRPPEGGESELGGALLAVDHINPLAGRYFVQKLPHQGESVLQSLYVEKEDAGSSEPSALRDLVISALLFNLGFLRLAVLGEFSSAASVLQQAIELRKAVLGEAHSLTMQAVVSRGWALTLTGDTLLAVEELTSAAEALLSAGQPHAADRLLRQGLQQGYDPLGGATYAHACYTQHSNMLRAWGSEGIAKADAFCLNQLNIAKKARLTGKERPMKRATRTLAVAVRAQIEDETEGRELLKLNPSDKERLWEEIGLLLK
ncbi:Pc13g00620 [Ectocarpus siliculosus]|uniref:Pc13g00620 n=1 Tax=Ectocarpus siliculosus TaxID=2880 RepID=D7G862_ECTSI|nr:Pc13g00620 [Ectocarpus siliculosus]|eukprot:CBJ27925.1 Pc13g00620 [Ectocarpus siliculosus]